jgi:hypothetical protein
MWAVHNTAVRSVGLGSLSDNLYRICIPLQQLATASFLGLLLVLAAGYCITRNNLGPYKLQVIGLPVLILVTGVVTDYINFQMLQATNDELVLMELAGWEAGLFTVCLFAKIAAFMFWVVYIFEIIEVEVDALRAQRELNLVRNAAPTSTVAPFPAEDGIALPFHPHSSSTVASDPHAAPPAGMDPDFVRAAADEGIVAYKNLLGPGQNMSHIPGADVEAQEITTVADMLNFEAKSNMYKKFTKGFGVYILAQLCVFLSPVFIIDIVQDVITLFQFLVVYGFLAALLWLFRPLEDSPYLLMGDDVGHLDTALGVDNDEQQDQQDYSTAAATSSSTGVGFATDVEMTAAAGLKAKSVGGSGDAAASAAARGGGLTNSTVDSWDQLRGRDQRSGEGIGLPVSNSAREMHPDTPLAVSPAAAWAVGNNSTAASGLGPLVSDVPASLPAIRTSLSGQQKGQQHQHGPAAAFSLEDDDNDGLQEIKLSSSPVKTPSKRD